MVPSSHPSEVPDGQFAAAFVDLHLTGDVQKSEGLDLIKRLRSRDPHLEIVAMSGNHNRTLMEDCYAQVLRASWENL